MQTRERERVKERMYSAVCAAAAGEMRRRRMASCFLHTHTHICAIFHMRELKQTYKI
jgi:hypothetical protein